MSPPRRSWNWLLGLTLVAAVLPEAVMARDATYTVKPGDNLDDLARRYLVPSRTWRDLKARNRIAEPLLLRPGSVLAIPEEWLKLEPQSAELTAFRGSLDISVAAKARVAQVGMRLPQRSTLSTRTRSFASLTLPDGSVLSVLPDSTVRITTLASLSLTGGLVRLIDVDTGRLQSTVTPAKRIDDSFRVRTPLAIASVRGTVFRTVFDQAAGTSRVELLKGSVAVTGGGDVLLGPGEGVAVSNGQLGEARKLLAAPQLVRPGQLQDGERLHFTIQGEGGAARWHLVVAADAGFIEQLDETTVNAPQADLAGLPDGTYFVRATAISAEGFEGLARDYSFRRERYGFAASLGIDKQGAIPVYHFRWQPPPGGKGRFRFVLRNAAAGGLPLVDEPALTASEIRLSALPAGTYRWSVARWIEEDGEPILKWDEEHELVVAR